MTLKYVGPKPLISVSGVIFDNNKEDKFVFLSIVAELIRALDHEYIEGERYISITGQKPLDANIIFSIIRTYDPALEQEIADRKADREKEIGSQIEHAKGNRLLCDEECQVLIKNIELLRTYNIQRTINKSVYYSGINTLARLIQKGHISHITAPMYATFAHVFHSIQGALKKLHPPIDSNIDVYEEDGHLNVQLKLKSI